MLLRHSLVYRFTSRPRCGTSPVIALKVFKMSWNQRLWALLLLGILSNCSGCGGNSELPAPEGDATSNMTPEEADYEKKIQ